MKERIIALLITLSFIITCLSGCKKENDYSELAEYSITELVDMLSEQHKLDEIFNNLKYVETDGTEKSLEELEKEYNKAIEENDIETAELKVYKMSRLLICARIAEGTNYNPTNNDIKLHTAVDMGNSEYNTPNIEMAHIKFILKNNDDDEVNKLAINSENAKLLTWDYARQTNAQSIYFALKRHILATCEIEKKFLSENYKISGDIDEAKYEFIKNQNIKKLKKF